MSSPPPPVLGRYHFLSHVRRGIGRALSNVDPLSGPLPARPTLDVKLTVNARTAGAVTASQQAGLPVRLHGPGDVVGIDPRHVIRTEPRAFTPNYEANYFAGIEFDHPEFPWLFTPAAPSGDRLRPWLVLIVLKTDEFDASLAAPDPLPSIVLRKAALPDLSDSWAWAHAQVTGDLPGDGIAGLMSRSPQLALSRLLCPRKLEPSTGYAAFVVPAFEAGRLAGLGQDTSAIVDTQPAWQPSTASLQLPVYYRFDFSTADKGDFESLVRQLTPRVLPKEVGTRPLDVSKPGPHIPSAGLPLNLSGALRSVIPNEVAWQDPGKSDFQGTLVPLINLTYPPVQDPDAPPPDDPPVVPPIYGRWHAKATAVNPGQAGWINQLNTDPRPRSMSGFGTRVVDHEKVPLMASAWQQVAAIERANQMLKYAQMARAAMTQSFAKHFLPAVSETMLTLTAPLHARVLASPRTIRATIAQSRLPVRALSPPFRRVSRPLGPIRRRQGATQVPPGQIVARLNSGEIDPVPPLHPPGGMVSIDQVSDTLYPGWAPAWLRALLPYLYLLLLLLALILVVVILGAAALLGAPVVGLVAAAAVAAVLVASAIAAGARSQQWRAAGLVRFASLSPQQLGDVPPQPRFQMAPPGSPSPPAPPGGPGDSAEAAAFRAAVSEVALQMQAPAPDPPPPPGVDLAGLRTTLVARLDPAVTVPARMAALVQVSDRLHWTFEDPIEPIMAAPEFPQPMYEPLRDLDQSLLLPGVELIQADTVGLLETNDAFVEAYMVGLNHEMARQLLWEGYPTDQRGSYFRQFWDVRAYVPTPADPTDPDHLKERLKDIKPIHTWQHASALGENQNRPELAGAKLVLLVRGELFRRYPNTVVYAAKAHWNGEGHPRVIDDSQHKYPIFRGTLTPDITFIGFDLTPPVALGGNRQSGDGGWFFVFQEQPTEPRFGLEPNLPIGGQVHEWNDLSWANFNFPPAAGGAPVFALARINPTGVSIQTLADNPQDKANAWGRDSAQIAFIAFRRPIRVAVHAHLMLPNG